MLESESDFLQYRLVAIKEEVNVTGDEDAKVTAEVLKKKLSRRRNADPDRSRHRHHGSSRDLRTPGLKYPIFK